jgi:alpha-L-fucosidase
MSHPTCDSVEAPAYLADFAETYAAEPRAAARKWFVQARYGLFLHYGLYSLLGRHEWVQYRENIRPGDYAELAHAFTAERFDAGAIADFAVACGMRYVNITTRHHDGFCLWETKQSTFHSGRAAAGRDLVAELAEACDRRGLGLFLYYSHGRDWKHPHAPGNDRFGGKARPDYDPPEPTYAIAPAHDLDRYVDFMAAQVEELLTGYGPIAGIWLDGIAVPLHPKDAEGREIDGFDPRTDGDVFRCQELYDRIHELQPQTLVSYKQGYLGTEDFFAPEHIVYNRFGQEASDKPGEVCTKAGPGWGYTAEGDHAGPDEIWAKLTETLEGGYNLLLNVAPLPDGALPEQAIQTLLTVGRRLADEGFPGQ